MAAGGGGACRYEGSPCYGNTWPMLLKTSLGLLALGLLMLGTMFLRIKWGEDFDVGKWVGGKGDFLYEWYVDGRMVPVVGTVICALSLCAASTFGGFPGPCPLR